jgi:predicted Fe-Mo cluster-binding NifX family protein
MDNQKELQMKIAFPTQQDAGVDSQVHGHFGSARFFVIMDSDADSVRTIENPDRVHLHGQCQPLNALNGEPVDAVVAGGIGGGALRKLNAAGIRVFKSSDGTVRENFNRMAAGELEEYSPFHTCGAHGAEHACAH